VSPSTVQAKHLPAASFDKTVIWLAHFETMSGVAMNPISAKCGHVKRRLNQGQRLKGRTLEFALGVIDEAGRSSNDELMRRIAQKLLSGVQLDEHEYHLMVDVVLLHKRLSAA
jgi:hypothetical protein